MLIDLLYCLTSNILMQVLKLRAICSHCRKEAAFTHRIGDEEDIEVNPTEDCLGVLPGCINFDLVLQSGTAQSWAEHPAGRAMTARASWSVPIHS